MLFGLLSRIFSLLNLKILLLPFFSMLEHLQPLGIYYWQFVHMQRHIARHLLTKKETAF